MELKRPRRRAGNSFFMRNCTRILKRGNLPAADEVTSPITSRLGVRKGRHSNRGRRLSAGRCDVIAAEIELTDSFPPVNTSQSGSGSDLRSDQRFPAQRNDPSRRSEEHPKKHSRSTLDKRFLLRHQRRVRFDNAKRLVVPFNR